MPDPFPNTVFGKTADYNRRRPVKIEIGYQGSLLRNMAGVFHLLSQTTQAASDVQIDKTFDDDMLITSFGQKVQPMQLVCIALPPEACPGIKEGKNGVSEDTLAQLYRNRHAGSKRYKNGVTKIKVTFDKVVFEGVLTGLSQVPHKMVGDNNFDVFRYTLTIQGAFR